MKHFYRSLARSPSPTLDYEYCPFFLRDGRTSETQARVKITPREKGVFFTRARVSLALLSLRKMGTTRSLHPLPRSLESSRARELRNIVNVWDHMSRVTSKSLEQFGWFACGLRDYSKIPKISPSIYKPPPPPPNRSREKPSVKSPLQIKSKT